jgi:hypothetical protein
MAKSYTPSANAKELFARITPNFELELKTSKNGRYTFHYKYNGPFKALQRARKIAKKFGLTLTIRGFYEGQESYTPIPNS